VESNAFFLQRFEETEEKKMRSFVAVHILLLERLSSRWKACLLTEGI
jgi:hypothetical protein